MGILLRVSCIFVADGVKTELRLRVRACALPFWGLLFDTPTRDAVTGPSSRSPFGLLLRRDRSGFEFGLAPSFLRRDRQKAEDSLEVAPLVCRVRVMVLRVVF